MKDNINHQSVMFAPGIFWGTTHQLREKRDLHQSHQGHTKPDDPTLRLFKGFYLGGVPEKNRWSNPCL